MSTTHRLQLYYTLIVITYIISFLFIHINPFFCHPKKNTENNQVIEEKKYDVYPPKSCVAILTFLDTALQSILLEELQFSRINLHYYSNYGVEIGKLVISRMPAKINRKSATMTLSLNSC
ncbi:hypothetical protein LOAG_10507 [Loa loa]|uniref:Uncharacterized protein n=1 Tax=Loa loa TaxID=7209 RepID=A0A1S0TR01_LOALO|nr:hypothetical protein LOAG_10507 [Loa loa]EFO17991.1 hypothetical protein LOAG_10507 [Loa loa]